MSASVNIQSKVHVAHQHIVEFKEVMEMNLNMKIENATNWLTSGLKGNTVVNHVGGIALGVALATAVALGSGTAHADGPNSPSVNQPSSTEQAISDSILERQEVQRVLANTPNLEVAPTFSDSITERQEVQRLLGVFLSE